MSMLTKRLNVVICIYHTIEGYGKSSINKILEQVQLELKEECEKYEDVKVAYVYETPSLLDVKKFEKLEKQTPIYYKKLYSNEKMIHNLAHIWFMGLALLEQQVCDEKQGVENRIYLITDEQFKRVETNQLVFEQNGELMLHPRFAALKFKPILIKTEQAGGDLLENYICQNGEVRIEEAL